MIKYYFLQIGVLLGVSRKNEHRLYSKLNEQFLNVKTKTNDVFLEENYLHPIKNIIEKLESLQVLNTSFAKDFDKSINFHCQEITKPEYYKGAYYIDRSFHEEQVDINSYSYLLKYAINEAITNHVSQESLNDVVDILETPFDYEL
jgi:hypothetical protein